jgi:hypothetical protein
MLPIILSEIISFFFDFVIIPKSNQLNKMNKINKIEKNVKK